MSNKLYIEPNTLPKSHAAINTQISKAISGKQEHLQNMINWRQATVEKYNQWFAMSGYLPGYMKKDKEMIKEELITLEYRLTNLF